MHKLAQQCHLVTDRVTLTSVVAGDLQRLRSASRLSDVSGADEGDERLAARSR